MSFSGLFLRYPSDADKHLLARQTGLSRNQVSPSHTLFLFLYINTHFIFLNIVVKRLIKEKRRPFSCFGFFLRWTWRTYSYSRNPVEGTISEFSGNLHGFGFSFSDKFIVFLSTKEKNFTIIFLFFTGRRKKKKKIKIKKKKISSIIFFGFFFKHWDKDSEIDINTETVKKLFRHKYLRAEASTLEMRHESLQLWFSLSSHPMTISNHSRKNH